MSNMSKYVKYVKKKCQICQVSLCYLKNCIMSLSQNVPSTHVCMYILLYCRKTTSSKSICLASSDILENTPFKSNIHVFVLNQFHYFVSNILEAFELQSTHCNCGADQQSDQTTNSMMTSLLPHSYLQWYNNYYFMI